MNNKLFFALVLLQLAFLSLAQPVTLEKRKIGNKSMCGINLLSFSTADADGWRVACTGEPYFVLCVRKQHGQMPSKCAGTRREGGSRRVYKKKGTGPVSVLLGSYYGKNNAINMRNKYNNDDYICSLFASNQDGFVCNYGEIETVNYFNNNR